MTIVYLIYFNYEYQNNYFDNKKTKTTTKSFLYYLFSTTTILRILKRQRNDNYDNPMTDNDDVMLSASVH
jgi:hypothetical protein